MATVPLSQAKDHSVDVAGAAPATRPQRGHGRESHRGTDALVGAQVWGRLATGRFGLEIRVSQCVLASCRSAWVTSEKTSVAV